MYAIVGWTLIVCTARGPFAPEAADRKTGVEFILSSIWVPENRLIPVNGGDGGTPRRQEAMEMHDLITEWE